MTNSAAHQTLEGLIEHFTYELVEALEFYLDKENGLGLNIKNAITRAEITRAEKLNTTAGETSWKNALTIVFGRGNKDSNSTNVAPVKYDKKWPIIGRSYTYRDSRRV